MMIRTILISGLILLAGIFIDPALSYSHPGHGRPGDRRPYGGYCQGPRWGWYGAKKPVKTRERARRLLEQFFGGEDVVIGKITERRWFFQADVLDNKGKRVDRVIVDKRTGRVRSIY